MNKCDIHNMHECLTCTTLPNECEWGGCLALATIRSHDHRPTCQTHAKRLDAFAQSN